MFFLFLPYCIIIPNSTGKKPTKSKSAQSAPNTKNSASSKQKSPSTLSDTKKAAKQAAKQAGKHRREMVKVGPVMKHASLLTKEEARVAAPDMKQEQLLAYGKANGVGSKCPEEYRFGLTPTNRTRLNVTNYLNGLPCKLFHLSIRHLYSTLM